MINKQAKERLYCVILALLLLAVMLVGGRGISFAFADTPQFTSALTDLQKDSNFNADEYPDNANDYSIQVIQIAESTDKKLLIYTYQPSQTTTYIVATDINMSLSEVADDTKLYGLTLLSTDGVFCKYKVKGITVSNEAVRYYNISSIYREWIKDIDKQPDNDNTVNSVAFRVGQLWSAKDKDGSVVYSKKIVDVIEIKDSYVGSIRYISKSFFYAEACDSFFIAFTTDKPIHTLYEADVSFSYYPYICEVDSKGKLKDGTFHSAPTNAKSEIAKLKADESTDVVLDGIVQKHYTWKWIQTAKDFKADENLSSEQSQNIPDGSWVLRFFASELSMFPISGGIAGVNASYSVRGFMPTETVILRLKFEYMGKVYNLGAVSDKITGGIPNGSTAVSSGLSWLERFFRWLSDVTGLPEWVLKLIAVVIILSPLLAVLCMVFPAFGSVLATAFKAIGKSFVWVLKGLWGLICLPFKGIAALIRKIKDKKEGAA